VAPSTRCSWRSRRKEKGGPMSGTKGTLTRQFLRYSYQWSARVATHAPLLIEYVALVSYGVGPSVSATNKREFVNCFRMASTSFQAAEAYQLLALSTLSKAIMT
jgi:hypothetical protein